MRARESWNWRLSGLVPAANFIASYTINRPSKWIDLALFGIWAWAFLYDDSD